MGRTIWLYQLIYNGYPGVQISYRICATVQINQGVSVSAIKPSPRTAPTTKEHQNKYHMNASSWLIRPHTFPPLLLHKGISLVPRPGKYISGLNWTWEKNMNLLYPYHFTTDPWGIMTALTSSNAHLHIYSWRPNKEEKRFPHPVMANNEKVSSMFLLSKWGESWLFDFISIYEQPKDVLSSHEYRPTTKSCFVMHELYKK